MVDVSSIPPNVRQGTLRTECGFTYTGCCNVMVRSCLASLTGDRLPLFRVAGDGRSPGKVAAVRSGFPWC